MLRLRKVPIDTGFQNIAFINRHCSEFQIGTINSLANRVEIHGGLQPLYANVYLVDDNNIVGPDELGLSLQPFYFINLPEGADVAISPSSPPTSIESIRRKINGGILSAKEYQAIISDLASYRYTPTELAAFLVSNASFNSPQEVLSLTQALASHRQPIDWGGNLIVDEHCIGGIPANRVSMIVAPIVIAYGMLMPNTLTHSVTSCSGAADAMEVLANVSLSEEQAVSIVSKIGGCMLLDGGGLSTSAGEEMLLGLEKSLGLSTSQQIVASSLASKIALGINHVLVDIPVGKTAKVHTMSEAMNLRKLFEYVGDMMGIRVDVIVTDGSEPVGRGIGPVLEARDVMNVLRLTEDAPQDLREKSLFIAGRILEFDPQLRGGQGYQTAREILDSGKAYETMMLLIHEQGKQTPPPLGQLTRDITSPISGVVAEIDCSQLNKISMTAGTPLDKGAGLDLLKKTGDTVEQGDVLYRIYASKPTSFAFANGLAEGNSGYKISAKGISSY
ncbi:MAG: thymidine phosphorylase [Alphaproteobacteria bacterium]|nr:thymidine phosphorylase [Alphaproteobacteria bacterium]